MELGWGDIGVGGGGGGSWGGAVIIRLMETGGLPQVSKNFGDLSPDIMGNNWNKITDHPLYQQEGGLCISSIRRNAKPRTWPLG